MSNRYYLTTKLSILILKNKFDLSKRNSTSQPCYFRPTRLALVVTDNVLQLWYVAVHYSNLCRLVVFSNLLILCFNDPKAAMCYEVLLCTVLLCLEVYFFIILRTIQFLFSNMILTVYIPGFKLFNEISLTLL